MGQKHTYKGTKAFLKGRKPGLLEYFLQFPCSWIRICIPNTEPDPGQPNECGFGSTTLVASYQLSKRSNKHYKNYGTYGMYLGVLGSSMIPDGLFLRLVG
jgi:hypothetical protein